MKKIRILYLEDDVNDAELLAVHLHSAQFPCDILHVKSEKTFSTALDQGGFDVILVDNSGPFFDGFAALAVAKKMRPEIPFVFLTGSEELGAPQRAKQEGAAGYVLKHRMEGLIPCIQSILSK